MVTEEYLGRSRLFRRLKSGPHGQIVELYAARLVKDELAGMVTWRCLYLVDDLVSWIKRCGSSPVGMSDEAAVMVVERTGQVIAVGLGQPATGGIRPSTEGGSLHAMARAG